MHAFADSKIQKHCFCITYFTKSYTILHTRLGYFIHISGLGENLYHHRYVYEFFFSPLPKFLDPQHPSTKHTKKRN